jgi:hypothetical protein
MVLSTNKLIARPAAAAPSLAGTKQDTEIVAESESLRKLAEAKQRISLRYQSMNTTVLRPLRITRSSR